MSFTFDFQSQPLLTLVRMLVPDTDAANPIFQDDEVNAAIFLESSQGLYVSSMSAPSGTPVPTGTQVYSPRRAAAVLVDCIAGNWSKLAVIEQILDVKLNGPAASKALRDHADSLRRTEAMSGAFAIAEWANDPIAQQERVYKQLLRLYPG